MLSVLTGLRRLAASSLLGTILVSGCGKKPAAAPPASEKPKVESDLSRTTLAPEERASLKIVSQTPTIEVRQEQHEFPGWVQVPPGREVTVTAPVPGYVRQLKDTPVPVPGSSVKSGDGLLELQPELAPLDYIQLASLKRGIDSDVSKATESVAVSKAEEKRVNELVEQKLRGKQDLEQAKARLAHALADLEAATEKQKLLTLPTEGKDRGRVQIPPFKLSAPLSGKLLTVLVSPGQYVAAGTPLLSVADLSELWLRVPVPAQDLASLDEKSGVDFVVPGLRDKDDNGKVKHFKAVARGLVPLVEPDVNVAQMLYAVKSPIKGLIAKDQQVTVYLPMGTMSEQTSVPYSAVVFDAYAGAWIYLEKSSEDAKQSVFERRRVELGPSAGNDIVVLRSGLTKDDRVVIDGAQALFSREFHKPPVGKGPKEAVDDDD